MSKVKKGLTPQEQKAVAGLMLGKTKKQAIKDAYNCKNMKVAETIGTRVFKRQRVMEELEACRNRERDILLPLAVQRIEEILRSQPKNKPNWETIRKASSEVVGRNTDEKTGGLTLNQYNFLSRFYNLKALGKSAPKTNKETEPIVIEERGSLLEEGNENSEERDINGGNDNNSNASNP